MSRVILSFVLSCDNLFSVIRVAHVEVRYPANEKLQLGKPTSLYPDPLSRGVLFNYLDSLQHSECC